jgi:TonB family protein
LAAAQTTKIDSLTPLLKQGDAAMLERKWHNAEDAFQQAAEADPASADAHNKLSNALAVQLHPGVVTTPENRPLLMRVLAERQRAVELAPGDPKFLSQLSHLQDAIARSSLDPDEATRSRNLAVQNTLLTIQLKPNDPDLHFDLATMELFSVNRAVGEARGRILNQGNAARLRDESIRQPLALQYDGTLDDAIVHTAKVIELQSTNGFAMLLTSVSHYLLANLASSDAGSAREMGLATQWEARFKTQWGANYSLDTERRLVAGLLGPQVAIVADPSMGAVMGGVLGGVTAPPPSSRPCNASSADRPVQPNSAPPEANLIKKVDPMYPPVAKSARVQGTVEFTIIIDKTGHVREAHLVKGHPLLVAAARESVLQWEYRPLIQCGQPIEVITDAIVNFTLSATP